MWHNFYSLHKNRERAIVDWFGCIIFFRFLFYFLLSIFFFVFAEKSWKKKKNQKKGGNVRSSSQFESIWTREQHTTTTQSSGLLYLGIYLYFYMKLVIIIRTVTGIYIGKCRKSSFFIFFLQNTIIHFLCVWRLIFLLCSRENLHFSIFDIFHVSWVFFSLEINLFDEWSI